MLDDDDRKYYSDLVLDNASNTKRLFRVMNNLLNRKQVSPLPPHDDSKVLANRLGNFFQNKILDIYNQLSVRVTENLSKFGAELPRYNYAMNAFQHVSPDKINTMLSRAPSKSCELDPLPTWLVKKCGGVLNGIISHIVNTSLGQSVMPCDYKRAILAPLLKKEGLPLIDKNFRPVSNLAFLSKFIERCAADQMLNHMTMNGIHEPLQSAYKAGHSTETALVQVHNDICSAMDQNQVTILVLLDLSAAFDTVDHTILLNRLSNVVGIKDRALAWFKSYLTGRSQRVKIRDAFSDQFELSCGVPQGSVLGPLLFTVYLLPLGDLVRRHGVKFHMYADDSQLYIVFKPIPSQIVVSIDKISACAQEIDNWMTENRLKFNGDKTDMIIIGTRQMLRKLPTDITVDICGNSIGTKRSVRNLGVIFHANFNLKEHIAGVCKSAFFHLHNISLVRKYLTPDAASVAVHAFVTSRLDYANALLYGLPKCDISRLQRIQNAAARLVTGTRKREHITPILKQLHWLPVSFRVVFKILVLAFNAVHGTAPSYLCDLVNVCKPGRTLRSSSEAYLLEEPRTRLQSGGDRAFSKAAPVLWNRLPSAIRGAESLSTFKRQLKTHLYQQAYLAC